MKKKILGIFLLLVAVQSEAKEVLLDRIAAWVDAEPILYSEIEEKISNPPLVKISSFPSEEESPKFSQALDDAINIRLIRRKAGELEIEISDKDVEEQITELLVRQNSNRDGLKQFLEKFKKTYNDYKRDIKDQMLFSRLKGRVILPSLKITDKDVEAYYLKKQGSTQDVVELSLRQILVAGSEDPAIREEKRKLALQIYDKLKSGMAFEEAEKVYSDFPDVRKSDTAPVSKLKLKDLSSEIKSQVSHLKVGEFTASVRTARGFIIFYVADRKITGSQEFLKKQKELEMELRELELIKQTNSWLRAERERTKIKVLKE